MSSMITIKAIMYRFTGEQRSGTHSSQDRVMSDIEAKHFVERELLGIACHLGAAFCTVSSILLPPCQQRSIFTSCHSVSCLSSHCCAGGPTGVRLRTSLGDPSLPVISGALHGQRLETPICHGWYHFTHYLVVALQFSPTHPQLRRRSSSNQSKIKFSPVYLPKRRVETVPLACVVGTHPTDVVGAYRGSPVNLFCVTTHAHMAQDSCLINSCLP